MPGVTITRAKFLEDNQGRMFSDVVNDPEQPFDAVLEFFNDDSRQRRMEESEIHHDRPPLAGVVRELESHPAINRSLAEKQAIAAGCWRCGAYDHAGQGVAEDWPKRIVGCPGH